jgi:hypothetical protein
MWNKCEPRIAVLCIFIPAPPSPPAHLPSCR